jgi:hypothetical protein
LGCWPIRQPNDISPPHILGKPSPMGGRRGIRRRELALLPPSEELAIALDSPPSLDKFPPFVATGLVNCDRDPYRTFGRPRLHSVFPHASASRARLCRPTPPSCTWGPRSRPFASHAHACGQQLQQVTTVGGYASIQERERGWQMTSRRREGTSR